MKLDMIDVAILTRIEDRPSWLKSLSAVRGRWNRLADAGLCVRCKPPTGGATNMLRITDAGRRALEQHRARKAA